jgi:hypothetical protein
MSSSCWFFLGIIADFNCSTSSSSSVRVADITGSGTSDSATCRLVFSVWYRVISLSPVDCRGGQGRHQGPFQVQASLSVSTCSGAVRCCLFVVRLVIVWRACVCVACCIATSASVIGWPWYCVRVLRCCLAGCSAVLCVGRVSAPGDGLGLVAALRVCAVCGVDRWAYVWAYGEGVSVGYALRCAGAWCSAYCGCVYWCVGVVCVVKAVTLFVCSLLPSCMRLPQLQPCIWPSSWQAARWCDDRLRCVNMLAWC